MEKEEKYVEASRVWIEKIPKLLASKLVEKYHYSHRLSSCRYPLGVFYQTIRKF